MSAEQPASIDWKEAERRIAELAETLRGEEAGTPEQIEATLQARARKLAAAVEDDETESGLEVIELVLAGEQYAIEANYIREVTDDQFHLTPLPGAPPYFAGVMNLRGQPLLVVDPRPLFELAVTELTSTARVLVLGENDADFGLIAESVSGVNTVPLTEIAEAPSSAPDSLRRYLRGVTSDAQLLLSGNALLSDSRLCIDEN